jgi:hypothetical protein
MLPFAYTPFWWCTERIQHISMDSVMHALSWFLLQDNRWWKAETDTSQFPLLFWLPLAENQDLFWYQEQWYMDFVLLKWFSEFFYYFDNCKRTDLGVLSGWRMLSTLLEWWFQSSNSSMTPATSGPVGTQLQRAVGLSLNQLLYHILWCRHCSARVSGWLGITRRPLSFVHWSSLL